MTTVDVPSLQVAFWHFTPLPDKRCQDKVVGKCSRQKWNPNMAKWDWTIKRATGIKNTPAGREITGCTSPWMCSWTDVNPCCTSIQNRCNLLLLSVLGHVRKVALLQRTSISRSNWRTRDVLFLETKAKVLPNNSGVRTIIKDFLIWTFFGSLAACETCKGATLQSAVTVSTS